MDVRWEFFVLYRVGITNPDQRRFEAVNVESRTGEGRLMAGFEFGEVYLIDCARC